MSASAVYVLDLKGKVRLGRGVSAGPARSWGFRCLCEPCGGRVPLPGTASLPSPDQPSGDRGVVAVAPHTGRAVEWGGIPGIIKHLCMITSVWKRKNQWKRKNKDLVAFFIGSDLSQLPWRCGHVRGGTFYANPYGKGRRGDAFSHPSTWRSSFHVD